MAYLLVLLIVFITYKKWRFKRRVADLHQKHKMAVILYSATWSVAGRKCVELLQQQMVSFVEFKVDQSPEASKECKSLGCRTLPVTVINGRVVEGFHPQKIKQLTDHI